MVRRSFSGWVSTEVGLLGRGGPQRHWHLGGIHHAIPHGATVQGGSRGSLRNPVSPPLSPETGNRMQPHVLPAIQVVPCFHICPQEGSEPEAHLTPQALSNAVWGAARLNPGLLAFNIHALTPALLFSLPHMTVAQVRHGPARLPGRGVSLTHMTLVFLA